METTINKIGFTPGPWKHNKLFHLYDPDQYSQIVGGIGFHSKEEKERGFELTGCMSDADARLITAAPIMYELLRKGLEDGEPMNWDKVSELLEWINP